MKKLLSLLLALALVFGLLGCQFSGFMEAPKEEPAQDQNTVQTPADQPVNWPELPSEEHTDEPSEEPAEEETIYDPRPHPADVQAEQDRLNEQQDREEANRQEQQEDRDEQPEQSEQPEQETPETEPTQKEEDSSSGLDPNGYYNTKDAVALYIHIYGRLPNNYITKSQGNSLYGSYKNIPSNMNIGGDRFGNREGLLPAGHTYYECDIGTTGGRNRGAKRIVFSSDGLVYYTDDHYESFTLLYGEP